MLMPYRCGFVAVIGAANVGKSTLMNRLIGCRLSITSPKPQTTQHRIIGIHTTDSAQALYIDTPGISQRSKRPLSRYLNRTAMGALVDADVVVWVVEAHRWRPQVQPLAQTIRATGKPTLLVLNKIDFRADRRALLPQIAAIQSCLGDLSLAVEGGSGVIAVVPLSARSGENVDRLNSTIMRHLPVALPVFPEHQLTDRSERFLAAEQVREQLFRRLNQELPYTVSVDIEDWRERRGSAYITARIGITSTSQKPIIIGKQGTTIKHISTRARYRIAQLLDRPVHLKLWIVVNKQKEAGDLGHLKMTAQ